MRHFWQFIWSFLSQFYHKVLFFYSSVSSILSKLINELEEKYGFSWCLRWYEIVSRLFHIANVFQEKRHFDWFHFGLKIDGDVERRQMWTVLIVDVSCAHSIRQKKEPCVYRSTSSKSMFDSFLQIQFAR